MELGTNGDIFDTWADTKILLNINYLDPGNIKKRGVPFTNIISLPRTAKNLRLLGYPPNTGIGREHPITVSDGGVVFMEGKARIKSMSPTGLKLQVTEDKSFWQRSAEVKLKDIKDLPTYKFGEAPGDDLWYLPEAQALIDNTEVENYKSLSKFVYRATGTTYKGKLRRPALMVSKLIEKGLAGIGYELDRPDLIKKLAMTVHADGFLVTDFTKKFDVFKAGQTPRNLPFSEGDGFLYDDTYPLKETKSTRVYDDRLISGNPFPFALNIRGTVKSERENNGWIKILSETTKWGSVPTDGGDGQWHLQREKEKTEYTIDVKKSESYIDITTDFFKGDLFDAKTTVVYIETRYHQDGYDGDVVGTPFISGVVYITEPFEEGEVFEENTQVFHKAVFGKDTPFVDGKPDLDSDQWDIQKRDYDEWRVAPATKGVYPKYRYVKKQKRENLPGVLFGARIGPGVSLEDFTVSKQIKESDILMQRAEGVKLRSEEESTERLELKELFDAGTITMEAYYYRLSRLWLPPIKNGFEIPDLYRYLPDVIAAIHNLEGTSVDAASNMPDMSLWDLMHTVEDLFFIRFVKDRYTNTVRMVPYGDDLLMGNAGTVDTLVQAPVIHDDPGMYALANHIKMGDADPFIFRGGGPGAKKDFINSDKFGAWPPILSYGEYLRSLPVYDGLGGREDIKETLFLKNRDKFLPADVYKKYGTLVNNTVQGRVTSITVPFKAKLFDDLGKCPVFWCEPLNKYYLALSVTGYGGDTVKIKAIEYGEK